MSSGWRRNLAWCPHPDATHELPAIAHVRIIIEHDLVTGPCIGLLALGDPSYDLAVGGVEHKRFLGFMKGDTPAHFSGGTLLGHVLLEDVFDGYEHAFANIGTGEEV